MTLTIKACLFIVEDCTNLFLASLNIHILYEEDETSTLPTSSNHSSLSINILKPNNHVYDEFISMIVKNKAVYVAMLEVEEI